MVVITCGRLSKDYLNSSPCYIFQDNKCWWVCNKIILSLLIVIRPELFVKVSNVEWYIYIWSNILAEMYMFSFPCTLYMLNINLSQILFCYNKHD